MPFYLAGLEKLVGGTGFAVGGAVSMADAAIYRQFGETATTTGALGNPRSEPMQSAAATAAALAKHAPKVARIVAAFRAHPRIDAYLAQRPTGAF